VAQPAPQPPAPIFGGRWRWLAPVMGLFLLAAIVSGPRNSSIGYFAAAGTNNLLAPLAINHGYAYVGFHSKQNTLDESLEWTSRQRFNSSNGLLPFPRTNSLMR
jgi:hypothetical protein